MQSGPAERMECLSHQVSASSHDRGCPSSISFEYPNRQSVAIVGDGGFAMLMAELSTAVQHQLPIKIVVLKNKSLSEVRFEQKDPGYPNYGCDLRQSISSLSPKPAARTVFAA
jgi:TPP-dependent trihydroxycyclohexane-1,2-dione (THcHDO) dehydratase